ncbi:hypothetical protein NDU88_007425 [Pleurodeles waltl]|uniref:Uncharacterized protein n=1 Tax=Pleurodeles waltl TaxID=8319 RepID=A0AAV7N223_PLEWA|nr:hypothetical protein NDU88_007425 [Pleurodeles waltl]
MFPKVRRCSASYHYSRRQGRRALYPWGTSMGGVGVSPPRVRCSPPAEGCSRNGFIALLQLPFWVAAAAELSGQISGKIHFKVGVPRSLPVPDALRPLLFNFQDLRSLLWPDSCAGPGLWPGSVALCVQLHRPQATPPQC